MIEQVWTISIPNPQIPNVVENHSKPEYFVRFFNGWTKWLKGKTYNNHLNTEHLKSEHLAFQTLFCRVFKWLDHLISRTIQKLDIIEH